jgi:hypothetical protein
VTGDDYFNSLTSVDPRTLFNPFLSILFELPIGVQVSSIAERFVAVAEYCISVKLQSTGGFFRIV